MPAHYIVLTASGDAHPAGYTVRLGPLAFVTPADTVGETVGDGLEVVGGVVLPASRRPRPLRLRLPVRGGRTETNVTAAGLRLRRYVRALLNNTTWCAGGLYFLWDADPDLDGWLMVGGGDLEETDPGVSFGEFGLQLDEVYIIGRPGTHRPARIARVGDRRTGLIPHDTRRLLYNTDYRAQVPPAELLYLPGDSAALVRSGNLPVASTYGPARGSRRLYRTAAAIDGETISYVPDSTVLTSRTRYVDLDDFGAVRVWDHTAATTPYVPDSGTTERDERPDIYLGWTRVYGDLLDHSARIAIDNGLCRLVWTGPGAASGGLSVEHWDIGLGRYIQHGVLMHALGVEETRIVEATPERVVAQFAAGHLAMRVILQRGWCGPRVESYDDSGAYAAVEYRITGGGRRQILTSLGVMTSGWQSVDEPERGIEYLTWSTRDTAIIEPELIADSTNGIRARRTRVLVVQLAHDGLLGQADRTVEEFAASTFMDVRAVPTLVRR